MTPLPPPAQETTPKLEIWCFGCIGEAGHYLRRVGHREPEFGEQPWGYHIDAELCGGDKYALPDGKTFEHHKDGWTAVAFWDRGGDSRPNSNTVFLVHADATTEQIMSAAREQWPVIFTRKNSPFPK